MKKITLLTVLLIASSVAFAANSLPITGTFNKAIPEGWSYITNNATYPDPSFYSSGGLKMNFENQGIASPVFNSEAKIEVNIVLGALNSNTKTSSASEDVFTIEALNTANEAVATGTLKSVAVGDNKVTITGAGIVKVVAKMTGYYYDGTKRYNLDLREVTISSVLSGVNSPSADALQAFVSGKNLMIKNAVEGSKVEIYSALGSKVLTSTLEDGKVSLDNLSKGLYVVRIGKKAQKFML